MWTFAQAMWDWLHRLCGPLQRSCGHPLNNVFSFLVHIRLQEMNRVISHKSFFLCAMFFSTGPQWTNLSLQTGLRSAGCFVDEKSQSFYGGGGLCLPSN